MGFAVDAPAEPMVAGTRQLRQNPQYIGTVSMATYISCTKITYSHCFYVMCRESLYVILYFMEKLLYKGLAYIKYEDDI